MITLQSTDEEVIEEMRRIRVMYVFKHTLRYQSKRDYSEHSESVAEHIYSMNVIAQYFLPLEDPKGSLDRERIHELILFHELGEIETGDISFHQKEEEHRILERMAAQRVIETLPESMKPVARERLAEFEECITPEARFAFAVDKVEPIFEMFEEHVLPLFKKQNIPQGVAVGWKKESTKDFPYMRLFIDAWNAVLFH